MTILPVESLAGLGPGEQLDGQIAWVVRTSDARAVEQGMLENGAPTGLDEAGAIFGQVFDTEGDPLPVAAIRGPDATRVHYDQGAGIWLPFVNTTEAGDGRFASPGAPWALWTCRSQAFNIPPMLTGAPPGWITRWDFRATDTSPAVVKGQPGLTPRNPRQTGPGQQTRFRLRPALARVAAPSGAVGLPERILQHRTQGLEAVEMHREPSESVVDGAPGLDHELPVAGLHEQQFPPGVLQERVQARGRARLPALPQQTEETVLRTVQTLPGPSRAIIDPHPSSPPCPHVPVGSHATLSARPVETRRSGLHAKTGIGATSATRPAGSPAPRTTSGRTTRHRTPRSDSRLAGVVVRA